MSSQNYAPAPFRMKRRPTWLLRLEAEVEDHGAWRLAPVTAIVVTLLLVAAWALGGSQRPSLRYATDAARLLWLDLFGGEVPIDRSVAIYHELQAFDAQGYNAFDIAAISLYVTGTNFKRNEFERVLKRPNGRVRLLVLDPRIIQDDKLSPDFEKMARVFGDKPYVTFAECLLSTLSLWQIKKELGDLAERFEVRFYRNPDLQAENGHFLIGRAYHRYSLDDQTKRFDVIIPYGDPADIGIDSPLRPAFLFKDRLNDSHVSRHVEAFEHMWGKSVAIEEVVRTLPLPPYLVVPQ